MTQGGDSARSLRGAIYIAQFFSGCCSCFLALLKGVGGDGEWLQYALESRFIYTYRISTKNSLKKVIKAKILHCFQMGGEGRGREGKHLLNLCYIFILEKCITVLDAGLLPYMLKTHFSIYCNIRFY